MPFAIQEMRRMRIILIILGWLSVALGVIGIFLPLSADHAVHPAGGLALRARLAAL